MMTASSDSLVPEGDKGSLICALRDQVLKTYLVAISPSGIWQHALTRAFSLPPVSDPSSFDMRDVQVLSTLKSVFRFRDIRGERNLEAKTDLVVDAFAAGAKDWEENYRPLAEALAGNGNTLGLDSPARSPNRGLNLNS